MLLSYRQVTLSTAAGACSANYFCTQSFQLSSSSTGSYSACYFALESYAFQATTSCECVLLSCLEVASWSRRRALCEFARRRSERAVTRTILAKVSLSTLQTRAEPQRERFVTHDPCTGFTDPKNRSQKSSVFAQIVCRIRERTVEKALSFCTSVYADSRGGLCAPKIKVARHPSFCASTTPIPAEGSIRPDKSCKKLHKPSRRSP